MIVQYYGNSNVHIHILVYLQVLDYIHSLVLMVNPS